MLHVASKKNSQIEDIIHSELGQIKVETFETEDYVDDSSSETGKRVLQDYGKSWFFYYFAEGDIEPIELFYFKESDAFFDWRTKTPIEHTEDDVKDEIREKIVDQIFDNEYVDRRTTKAVFLFEYFGLDKSFLKEKITIKLKDLEFQAADCINALKIIGN